MHLEKLMQNIGFFTVVIFTLGALVKLKNVMILVRVNVLIMVVKILIRVSKIILKIIIGFIILRVEFECLIVIVLSRRRFLILIHVTIVAVTISQFMVIKIWVYILFVKRQAFLNAIEHVLFKIKILVANKLYNGLKLRKCKDKRCKVSMCVGEDCNDIANENFSVCKVYNCVYCEDNFYPWSKDFLGNTEWQQPERPFLYEFEIRAVTRGENM